MNFRQFEAFYWIGRLGSFHAAARHLRTSQPAISARIREMEIELGVTLFDRSDRKVRPTAKGQELLPYAAQLITIASEIQKRVGSREALSGRVRMGLTSISALTWGRSLLDAIARDYPGVSLELTVDASEVLASQLAEGELDVAALAGPLESTKVISESLGRVGLAWVASPKLDLPNRPLHAADVALFPVIAGSAGTYLRSAAMAWFSAEGVEPQRYHGCSSLPTRIQLAVQGVGISLASPSAANFELTQGALRIVPIVRPLPSLEYFIAYSDVALSPTVKIVAETAKLMIARKPAFDSYYSAVEHYGMAEEFATGDA